MPRPKDTRTAIALRKFKRRNKTGDVPDVPPNYPDTISDYRSAKESLAELQAIVGNTGCKPFEVLCHFANGDSAALAYPRGYLIDSRLRMKAAQELCEYLYPKRKSIEVTGAGGGPLTHALMQTSEQRQDRIAMLQAALAAKKTRG